ncbi:MAG: DUF2167 domain-containing protein [Gammaproteobacteria bacterium]|nr:DUF2167 domain-containing protein [Gammaproteobacteria bacterium]
MKLSSLSGYAFCSILFVLFLSILPELPASAEQQEDAMAHAMSDAKLTAIRGPANIPLLDQATLELPEGYVYVPAKEGAEIMQAMGNDTSSNFYGLVFPADGDSHWYIQINYIKSGYITDADAKNWNADELLSHLKEKTDEENKESKAKGLPTIDIVGWAAPPSYDTTTHKLIWAVDGNQSDVGNVINYTTIALGREGFFDLTLITKKSDITSDKEDANKILAALNYTNGKRYEDYVAGKDHLAEFGLATLITGVVAKKLGLFALIGVIFLKVWKGLIIFVVIFWKKIIKLLGLKK